MPSLRDLKDRIGSVKSTRKITSAMKMVAAAKLKKAQDQAEASQDYARAMAAMLARVAKGYSATGDAPKLLTGTGKDDVHVLVVVTSDRGLAGGFNANLVRAARGYIKELQSWGKQVKIVCIGRKGHDIFKKEKGVEVIKFFTGIGGKDRIRFAEVDQVSEYVLGLYEDGGFDRCTLIYNEFHSVLTQKPKVQTLIPFALPANDDEAAAEDSAGEQFPYEFEPNENEILARLLPKNIGVQFFQALLDSAAGEQAARMTAMDNATRNAGDMIKGLTLQYNRARQAYITKELIEIISGAEAV